MLRFVCHASTLAPCSQPGNEAMQPVLVWGQDTNTLPGPISRPIIVARDSTL